MTTLTLVVIGSDAEEIRRFDVRHVDADELVLLSNPGGRFGGLGKVGNHYIETALGDVLGVVHADVLFGPGACRDLARAALTGAVVGIVGKTLGGTVPHADEIEEDSSVSTLDSSSVFFLRGPGLRFDSETFDSFHCCVEDFCLQASSAGRPIVVPRAAARHLAWNVNQVDRASWLDEHTKYWRKLRTKWADVKFNTC